MERVGIGSNERKTEQKKENSFSQTESYSGPLGIKNL